MDHGPHWYEFRSEIHTGGAHCFFTNTFSLLPQYKEKVMGDSCGSAVVVFPGFKPVRFVTWDGKPCHVTRRWAKKAGNETSRLSKKDRSRLFTLANRWAKSSGTPRGERPRARRFQTLSETTGNVRYFFGGF